MEMAVGAGALCAHSGDAFYCHGRRQARMA